MCQFSFSNDGINFTKVGTVKGSGTTSQPQTYSYLDREMPAGTNYYRLTQKDFNGKTETFKPIVIQTEQTQSDFKINSVYPNPFSNEIKISYDVKVNSSVKINLLGADGKQIKSLSENANEGSNVSTINGLDNLPRGQYIIAVSDGGKNMQSKKVIKK